MAEVKNNFLKSKMNKDLDDRLVPVGEYRNAQNISIAKSEGNDVGALENILGNDLVSNFTIPAGFYNVEIIGHFMDVKNDRIIVFMTNYVDTSGDTLSNFSPRSSFPNANAYHAIGVYNINNSNSSIIVTGQFLNFSKTHEIVDVNLVNGLLFWTDNRNQPRKINLSRAMADSAYYSIEDTVSVSKYYPYKTIDLLTEEIISGTPETLSTMRDVVSDNLPDGTTLNPYRQPYGTGDITWKGDPEYLKDKFVRFSYRFKFDDGEYSLIAPFTQTCFIPKQDGYFIDDDDSRTFTSTEVDFMENKVNDITLIISSPTGDWDDIQGTMKIEEVDILYKEAGKNVIKIVDTITSNQLALVNSDLLTYNYTSVKPWKTLPDSDILRVSDQVPVRALTQEVAGNRVIYGNYINKPTPPSTINYSLNTVEKTLNTQIEYQNQNLKQNRTYQVGVVLSDRYGRQSTVILSSLDESNVGTDIKGSTIFHKFKETNDTGHPFSYWNHVSTNAGGLFQQGSLPITSGNVWDGDALNVTFWDIISSSKDSNTGAPGLYGITNPLGWYSYKIVVKQTEQDYYNIYFPGVLNGYADGDTISTGATASEPICHFALHGDNINKVPRDLSLVGPNQKTFRTGRPSVKDDPSYYQFTDSLGMGFSIDPFSEEGERLLKERDRERDLDSGSQITNASVKLSLRLNNVVPDTLAGSTLTAIDTTTSQAYPGTNLDIVTTIGTGQELGLWDPAAPSAYNTCYVFYGYENNPYIAKTNVSDPIDTGITGPTPNSGKFNFYIELINAGTGYVAGSTGVPVDARNANGAGTGFKVNIDTVGGSGDVTALSIADEGTGWDTQLDAAIIQVYSVLTGAGDANCTFYIKATKNNYEGNMWPSLAVYETEPLESKLDIYWETSTSGLIDELNTDILDGDIFIPISIVGAGTTDPLVMLDNEKPPIGSDITAGEVLNSLGNPVAGPITWTLLSLVDGYGNPRTDYSISSLFPPSNRFKVTLNEVQMCDWDQQLAENFTFTINAEVPNGTGGVMNRVVTFTASVLNLPPYLVPIGVPTTFTGSINGGLVHTFNAENGSNQGGGLERESITFTLTDPTGIFYLNPTTTDGEIQLMNNAALAGAYPITLNVFDGGGLTKSHDAIVTLS